MIPNDLSKIQTDRQEIKISDFLSKYSKLPELPCKKMKDVLNDAERAKLATYNPLDIFFSKRTQSDSGGKAQRIAQERFRKNS